MVRMVSKVKAESGKAKGSLPTDNAEHQPPPSLYLEHHHLEKLGLAKMPAIGTKVKISGLAHVGSTSENQDLGKGASGKPRRSMTLHLHEMEVGTDKQPGMSDEDQKAGMKAAIDKSLKKGAGSESKGNAENG